MAFNESQYQNDERLLDLRIKLDTKLKRYLQTKNDSNSENNPLQDFIREINKLSQNDKIIYRNYVSDIIKNVDNSFIKDTFDDIQQIKKLDLINVWGAIDNSINPKTGYEVIKSNNSAQTRDWSMSYKGENPTEVDSRIEKIREGEYKISVDGNNFKLIYNGGSDVILSRMTYNKAIRKFPVIIGRGGVPYSNIEIDMGGGSKFKGIVNFDIPNNDDLKVDKLLLGNKRVQSELTQIGENTYKLVVDNFYNYKVKYNPISNRIQILNGEEYMDNEILYEGIAHPIGLASSNIVETRYGRPVQERNYIMGADFNIKIGRQNLTGTIIVPK